MLTNEQFKLQIENIQSKKEIETLLKKYYIKNYTINSDGSVDVAGNVDLTFKSLTKLPFKFNKVGKNFYCNVNQLADLEGVPRVVGRNFDFSFNKLINLNGAPQEVKGSFGCPNNQLISLEGAPKEVGSHFDCSRNQLTNLKGAPQKVGGDFSCSRNQLVSLEGAPEILIGGFWLHNSEWDSERKHLKFFEKQEVTLDNITDTYGYSNAPDHGIVINVKEFLYKNNKLIKY